MNDRKLIALRNTIEFGDCRDILRRWATSGVKAQTCVTSPPYFGLRDYGVDGQIGLEQTPEEYIAAMVEVFRCVRDVLADDGTLWLNIGDSYAAQRGGTHQPAETLAGGKGGKMADGSIVNRDRHAGYNPTRNAYAIGLKHKDLIGIPWMLARAMQAGIFMCECCEQESVATMRLSDGRLLCKHCGQVQSVNIEVYDQWYLRQDIIWHKPNPMPESVRDRCTKAHEYIFLLSKSERYYFDARSIAQPIAESSKARLAQPNLPNQAGSNRVPGKTNGNMKAVGPRFGGNKYGDDDSEKSRTKSGNEYTGGDGLANRRSVWTVATRPYKGAHFATFPPALIEPCILAGSRTGDIVLDPFMGSGTTAAVALTHNRKYLGCELNPAYKDLQDERIKNSNVRLSGF